MGHVPQGREVGGRVLSSDPTFVIAEGHVQADPHELLITFPAEPMKMWPISKRVNSPRNDDEGLLTEIDLALASRAE